MTIDLTPELLRELKNEAQRLGVTPEQWVVRFLELRFPSPKRRLSHEEFRERIVNMGVDAGVSLSNEAASSESYYD